MSTPEKWDPSRVLVVRGDEEPGKSERTMLFSGKGARRAVRKRWHLGSKSHRLMGKDGMHRVRLVDQTITTCWDETNEFWLERARAQASLQQYLCIAHGVCVCQQENATPIKLNVARTLTPLVRSRNMVAQRT